MIALLDGSYRVNPRTSLMQAWHVRRRQHSYTIRSDGQIVWVKRLKVYRPAPIRMLGATP